MTRGVCRTDVALMAAFLVLSLAQVLFVQPLGSLPVSLLCTIVGVVPLAWWRARPPLATIVVTSTYWIPTEAYLFLGYVVAILLFFALGRWKGDWRIGAAVCAYALAAGTAGTLLGHEAVIPELLGAWLVVLGPYGVGRVMTLQEQENDARLQAEREAIRQQAVDEERNRIVRELHDVVGHEVTLMSIQSEAAAQALLHAPERAGEPISAVRETAHRAHRQLRAILDLLGKGEEAASPSARGLEELTDRAARLGIPNHVDVTGEPWPDAPQHWLAINRIVQECLTNAGKHAPGAKADIEVCWSPDAVRLRVANAAARPSSGAGLGLSGMSERARILGGTLDTTFADGVFVVHAWLPATEVRS